MINTEGVENAGVLASPSPQVDLDEAARALAECYGRRGQLKALGSERDCNFQVTEADGTRFVLKFTHPDEDRAVADFQVCALAVLAEREPEMPLPRVITAWDGESLPNWHLADGRYSQLRLSTFVAGTPLATWTPPPPFTAALGALLARLHGAVADLRHPVAEREMPWDLARADTLLASTDVLSDEVRGLVRRALETFAERTRERLARLVRQPIHNDLNNHNVLFDPERPMVPAGIIDFGDMLFGPRIADLAIAAAYRLHDIEDPFASVATLVAGYHRHSPLLEEERSLLFELIETRLAMAITVATQRAHRNQANAPYLLRSTQNSWKALQHCATTGAAAFERRLMAALELWP
jgi:Ser/Thr protein kinase RdoA (MazF antagonist)